MRLRGFRHEKERALIRADAVSRFPVQQLRGRPLASPWNFLHLSGSGCAF
jgi:hypothetical protein